MQFHKTTLKNGLKIITVPMPDNPAVTVLVMVETGSKYEKKEESGLSHFLEHMMFKGTPKRPKAIDISKELESIGAQYNAFTSQEYTGYYAKVSREHIDTALDVVSDIYLHPLLNEKEIEKEKGVIMEEIRMYQDLPHRHVHDLFMNLVYGDQSAGWNIAGDEQTVKSFNRDNFRKYLEEHYVAPATLVVIAGSFDNKNAKKNIKKKIEKAFENISKARKAKKEKVKEVQSKPEMILKFKETDQAHIVLGVRSYDARSINGPAMDVLTALLGKGMSSRLFQKLREEMGVGYYIHADHDAYTDHGLFTISSGIDTKRVDEVLKVLLTECRKIIDEPISKEELQKVKDYISGSFVLGLETSDSMAEYVSINHILKGKVESPKEEIKKIQKVTEKDVKRIAKEIFVDEKLNLAIIGPYKDEDKKRFENLLTFKK
ncbi:MAG TPA: pitrilysin family protein [Candidatus Paceibacterota bacterium]